MRNKLFIGAVAVALIMAGTFLGSTTKHDARAASAFDHSQCQYPDRTTNPADGCDNSDPCDPASAAKGGSGDCSDAPALQQPAQTVTQTTPALQTSNPTPVSECGK